MKIVVTGSLGHIGKPLAEILIKNGNEVIVISSDPEKQKDIEVIGATPAIGSLDDTRFLIETLSGADALFAMVPPNFGEIDQVAYYTRIVNGYAAAAKAVDLQRLVYLSSYGADLDSGTGFILGAHHAENILNAVPGLNVTHLRPGYFYYNLLNFSSMAKHHGFIGANYGGNDNMIFVAPEDIAVVAAEALQNTANVKRVHYIVSDEMTASEAAKILGTAIDKPGLEWKTFTDEQTAGAMQQRGMPEHIVKNFIELGASIHNGRMLQDYYRHKSEAMIGKIKLEVFAKDEFAAVYQKA